MPFFLILSLSFSIPAFDEPVTLHLVWSAYFISTAVRTALKVARTPQILGENGNYRSHYKSKKRIDFDMGPSVKFVPPFYAIAIDRGAEIDLNLFIYAIDMFCFDL